MAIRRWDPLRDLLQIQDKVNRLFDDVLSRQPGTAGAETLSHSGYKPPLDVIEQQDRYVLRIDLPGLAAADVDIELENDTLVLRGERKPDPSIPREAYLRAERPRGRFALQLAVPATVDRQGVQASHAEGVLEVVLPKRREEAPSRIKVDVQ